MTDEVKRHLFVEPYIYAATAHPNHGDRPCGQCHAPASAPQHYQAPVELSETGRNWLQALKDADIAIAAINKTILGPHVERRETALRNLQAELADSEAATVGGKPAVIWAWRKPATRIDTAGLRRDHPEIAEAYTTTAQPGRPFVVIEDADQ